MMGLRKFIGFFTGIGVIILGAFIVKDKGTYSIYANAVVMLVGAFIGGNSLVHIARALGNKTKEKIDVKRKMAYKGSPKL